MMKKLLKIVGALVAILVVAIVALAIALRHAAPTDARPGEGADALAHKIAGAVDEAAWARTGALRFRFSGRHELLWDRARGLTRVRFGDVETLVDLGTRKGVARRAGVVIAGPEGEKLVEKGYAWFCNDTFWLNPFVKLFDDGVERAATTLDGQPALYYGYRSGGVTPGDHYLIALGEDGKPARWRMWVHVIPVGGIESRAQEWTTLGTGAHLVTRWRLAGLHDVVLDELAAAETLAALEPGADPFAALALVTAPAR